MTLTQYCYLLYSPCSRCASRPSDFSALFHWSRVESRTMHCIHLSCLIYNYLNLQRKCHAETPKSIPEVVWRSERNTLKAKVRQDPLKKMRKQNEDVHD